MDEYDLVEELLRSVVKEVGRKDPHVLTEIIKVIIDGR
jgi:hypothetical protein